MKILLFDIDGTILDTGGAGGQSITEAIAQYAEVSIEGVPPLDLAGTTDTLVWKDLLGHFNLEHTSEAVAELSKSYLSLLEANLALSKFQPKLCPGVRELIKDLSKRDDCLLGLLTGNMREGAYLKLAPFDLGKYFGFGAFGDEHELRAELAKMAAKRGLDIAGLSGSEAADIWVIGDTPRDIACARAAELKVLAVATGSFSEAQLAEHQPDLLFAGLSDATAVCEALKLELS